MNNTRFVLSFSPHITDKSATSKIMMDLMIALLPAAACAAYFFSWSAVITIVLSMATAMGTEALIQFLTKQKITIFDCSAALTGLLLALNLPAGVPWYIPVIGSAFAIAVCKQCFGGLGHNFINPALGARAMLLVAWPVAMTTFVMPFAPDVISSATPLAVMKYGSGIFPTLGDMAVGTISGSMGETSAIALLLGGVYLMIRKVISWRIPVTFIASAALFLMLFAGNTIFLPWQLLGGGLFLGAFFMATDYVTSPMTKTGKIVFGVGCGLLVAVIRTFGGYPEGVCFAILFMNLTVPLIDRVCKPKIYGAPKKAVAK